MPVVRRVRDVGSRSRVGQPMSGEGGCLSFTLCQQLKAIILSWRNERRGWMFRKERGRQKQRGARGIF